MFATAKPLSQEAQRMLDAAIPGSSGPYLECQVVLRGGFTVTGVLTTDDNSLRLMTPAKDQRNALILVDHRFDYDDVMCIAVSVDVPSQARSGLILGH